VPLTARTSSRLARRLAAGASVAFVLAALGALWLRFNAPPGGGGPEAQGFLVFGDFVTYFAPMAVYTAGRLAAAEIPLWFPDGCSGIPLLASWQTAVLYPGTWLALVLPAHRALPLLVLLECALAGAFSVWLFRAWGGGWLAATAGGVLFVYACALGQSPWPPAVATIVWIPWLLLSSERLIAGRRRGWWAALALGAALQLLAGFPQYVLYGYLLVAPWVALRLWEERRRGGPVAAAAGAVASALLLAAGLAAAQLLPALELVRNTLRAEPLAPADVHYLNVLAFHDSGAFLRRALDPGPGSIVQGLGGATGYLGIATLVLVALGIAARPRDWRGWFFLVLGAGTLLLSDGYLGPARDVYAAFARLPLVGSLRTPERIRVVTFFCAIALAVRGFDVLGEAAPAARRRALAALAGAVAVALAAGMAAGGHGAGAWRAGLALLLVLAALLAGPRGPLRRIAAVLLLLFVTADVVAATAEQAALRDVSRERVERLHDAVSWFPPQVVAQARRAVGSARIEPLSLLPFVSAGESAGIRRMSCYEALVPAQWDRLHRKLTGRKSRADVLVGLDPEQHAALYDVTSVRRVLMPGRRGRVLGNDDALPRAFLQDRFRIVDPDEALEQLARGGEDFRRVVLVDRDPGFRAGEGAEPIPARLLEDEPERVVIRAEAAGPSLLVLTDTHYPGWEASVNGAPAEILLANGVHRAVRVDRGSSRVVFEFRPTSFRAGAAISLLALVILAVRLIRDRRAAG
jgi:hypothetical protein